LKETDLIDYLDSMDILGDYIIGFYKENPLRAEKRAREEIEYIGEINEPNKSSKEKCKLFIDIIRGVYKSKELPGD